MTGLRLTRRGRVVEWVAICLFLPTLFIGGHVLVAALTH